MVWAEVGRMDSGTRQAAIAGRLRAAREQAGLTQGQAAKVLGLNRPAVSEIEAGRRSVSAVELAVLAETYGVSVEWLVEAKTADPARDRMELAARELGKLKPQDLERLMQLLGTLKRTGEKKP
jgi:transcriptional regulator with XRE-family HTH domain